MIKIQNKQKSSEDSSVKYVEVHFEVGETSSSIWKLIVSCIKTLIAHLLIVIMLFQEDPNERKRLECKTCRKKFTQTGHLRQHERTHKRMLNFFTNK